MKNNLFVFIHFFLFQIHFLSQFFGVFFIHDPHPPFIFMEFLSSFSDQSISLFLSFFLVSFPLQVHIDLLAKTDLSTYPNFPINTVRSTNRTFSTLMSFNIFPGASGRSCIDRRTSIFSLLRGPRVNTLFIQCIEKRKKTS